MFYQVNQSKTKTHGFQMPYMCSGSEICAVCDMERYLKYRNNLEQLALDSPLFIINGKVATKNGMNAIIKNLLKAMGAETAGYSLHSIRYGATTTAAQNKFQDWEIKLIGGWSTNTYNRYINTTNTKHRARFAKRLVQ